ncbi:Uncharacterized protein TCM_035387 [Theobroma cacao]|uniref:Uncharacterized protein n=1 Tax=Theobroma cacao TaxID=3641 RepID=A0A061FGV9_THECC|nr:Uncharacterized protein TCM_035387 [Theobroma cacao]
MSPRAKQTKKTTYPASSDFAGVGSSSSSYGSSFLGNFMNASDAQKFRNNIGKLKVMPSRIIDFDYLESINFSLVKNFEILGWTYYLKLNQTYYESLVKDFYFTATHKFPDLKFSRSVSHWYRFITNVMAKRIIFTRELINNIHRIHTCIDDLGDVIDDGNLQSAFVFPLNNEGSSSYMRLCFPNRVLHLIINHTIHPHHFNYSKITKEDL